MPNLTVTLNAPAKPDEGYIRGMFDRLAGHYDRFTFLIGFGQAARFRNECLKPLQKGMRVLDLGCGTGDLAIAAVQKIGADGEVIGLDFSQEMLQVARQRAEKLGLCANIGWICKRAEDLPIGDRLFDLVVSGFVLRNLYANIDKILYGIHASLKPGGRISFLDLTEPRHPFLAWIFRFYMLTFVGLYGWVLFGKDYPVSYLPDSAKRFHKAHEFVEAIQNAGFRNVEARPFMLGSVTLYQADK